jgi:hypothetical protein
MLLRDDIMSGLQSCISSIKSNAAATANGDVPTTAGLTQEDLEAQKLSIDELAAVVSEMNDFVQSIGQEDILSELKKENPETEEDSDDKKDKPPPPTSDETAEEPETVQEESNPNEDEESKYKDEAKEEGGDDDSDKKDEGEEKESMEGEKESEETKESEEKTEPEAASAADKEQLPESKEDSSHEPLKSKLLLINTKLMDWAKRIEVAAERCETLQPVLSQL